MAEARTPVFPEPSGTAPPDWREIVRRWPLPSVGLAALVGLAAGRTLGPGGTLRAMDGALLRPPEAALLGHGIQALVSRTRSWLEDMEHRMKEGR